ncbi:MAG: hypothetical protein NTV46_06305 [Verrucomicrobia bacterium]|nr:hypothetical protein [Verrucomicrobiota bacterium]
MTARPRWILLVISWWVGAACHAEQIYWYSVGPASNLTSSGAAMTAGFSFELGVFKDGFVPGSANTADWAAKWVPAQRSTYNPDPELQRFDNQFTVTVANYITPFTQDPAAYVWGFQGGVASSEWILFRHDWTWPAPVGIPPNPNGLFWNAAHATAVLGTIYESGSPFLMQSAAVTNAASPPTTWQQWQTAELAGVASGPYDDPDHDGTNNLLEFVFGTPPKQAGAPPQTPVTLVNGHVQITIPRRIDHPAVLTVEVSSDLTKWDAGEMFTEAISNSPAALVVRDKTPLGPAHPRRFMRLKAELPTP